MGTFANRLKSLRLKHDLSQQELADGLNISKSSVSMYERGQREPDFKTLETIADFFNVDMNFIIGYSDEPLSWERIANDKGIAPPNDFEGDPEDWYKMKMQQEQDALIDSYYDPYPEEDINSDISDGSASVQPTKKEQNMIKKYRTLDTHGKDMVNMVLNKEAERMIEPENKSTSTIIDIPSHLEVNAAHARTDIEPTPEGRAHDDAIMNDDSEWE